MKEIIVGVLMFTGALFILIAALGLLRFRDLYSRMHATTKATSFGILLLIAGVTLFFSTWIITLKALLIIAFIYLTAPLAAHSIARSYRKDDTGKEH
jgi:multicomponent Na+:H+ antiporter subunit G